MKRPKRQPGDRHKPRDRVFTYLPGELGRRVKALAATLRPEPSYSAMLETLVEIGLQHYRADIPPGDSPSFTYAEWRRIAGLESEIAQAAPDTEAEAMRRLAEAPWPPRT